MLTEINIVGVPPRDGMHITSPFSDYNPVLELVTTMLKMVKSDGYWSAVAPEDLSFYIAEPFNVPISRENLLPRLAHSKNEHEVIDELLEIGFRLAPIPLSCSVHQFQSSREKYIAFIVPKIHPPEVRKQSPKATGAIFASKREFRERLMGHYLELTEKRRQEKKTFDDIESSMNTVKNLLDRGKLKERTNETVLPAKTVTPERLVRHYFGLEERRVQQKEKVYEIESFMNAVKSLLDKAKQNDQDLEEVARMKSEDCDTGLPRVLVKPMRLRLWGGLEDQEPQGSKGRESTLMDGAQSDEESDKNTKEEVRPKKKARGNIEAIL